MASSIAARRHSVVPQTGRRERHRDGAVHQQQRRGHQPGGVTLEPRRDLLVEL